jgi:hypothetical protein
MKGFFTKLLNFIETIILKIGKASIKHIGRISLVIAFISCLVCGNYIKENPKVEKVTPYKTKFILKKGDIVEVPYKIHSSIQAYDADIKIKSSNKKIATGHITFPSTHGDLYIETHNVGVTIITFQFDSKSFHCLVIVLPQ